MANMVEITEARFLELLKREETLDAYRKAYGEMQKERDKLKERLKKKTDACAHCIEDGRLAAAERCINEIYINVDADQSIVESEISKIISAYRKEKEVR